MVTSVLANGASMKEGAVKTAVVGASGYSGAELLRLLIGHPEAELVAVTSREQAGRRLAEVFPRFRGAPGLDELTFMTPDPDAIAASGADTAFLALPHGVAVEYAPALLERGLRVIDLSADFRLDDPAVYEDFYGKPHPAPELLEEGVYGLPEVHRDRIVDARLVASPGCYPTSILLPLIPALREGWIDATTISVSSMSGASGAGKKADPSLLFVEINESLRPYGLPRHRHLSEIEQELSKAAGHSLRVSFVPHLVPVTAGIVSTSFASLVEGAPDAQGIAEGFQRAYGDRPFVRLIGGKGLPNTAHVVGTNFIDIAWVIDERTGRLILTSAEDNLGKGASSQAVQSFNLMHGLAEDCGLRNF